MVYYNIPADFDIQKIKQYDLLNKKFAYKKVAVKSFYGNLNPSQFPSARYPSMLPCVDFKKLNRYINALHKFNFEFSYTFNGICLGNEEHTKEGARKISDFIKLLLEIGVDSITLSNFKIIDIIKKLSPRFKICISTNLQSMSAGTIKMLEELGVKKVILSTDINKSFSMLKDIVNNAKVDIEIILNSSCFLGCPFSYSHYSFISHSDISFNFDAKNPAYFEFKCAQNKILHPERLIMLSSFIRPEDIKLYYNTLGINFFKLVGRHKAGRDYLKNLEVFMEEHYEGNFFDIFSGLQGDTIKDMFYLNNRKLDHVLENLYHNKIDYSYNYAHYIKIMNRLSRYIKVNKRLKK